MVSFRASLAGQLGFPAFLSRFDTFPFEFSGGFLSGNGAERSTRLSLGRIGLDGSPIPGRPASPGARSTMHRAVVRELQWRIPSAHAPAGRQMSGVAVGPPFATARSQADGEGQGLFATSRRANECRREQHRRQQYPPGCCANAGNSSGGLRERMFPPRPQESRR